MLSPLAAAVGLSVWQGLSQSRLVPAYLLPTPGAVVARWVVLANNGVLWHHASTTLTESDRSPSTTLTELGQYVAATQAMPMVALAPLVVVWFGLGLLSKVLILCADRVFPAAGQHGGWSAFNRPHVARRGAE